MTVNRATVFTTGGREQCGLKRDLKEAGEEAERRSDSREFHTEVTAVGKAYDAKYEAAAGFVNRKADNDQSSPAS